MSLNTAFKKSLLAIFIACGSVVWLNKWHQVGYTRTPISFPPVSNWLRDSIILLIPVMLAVWLGMFLTNRLIDRSSGRISSFSRSMLATIVVGGLTTLSVLLVENSRAVWTGIGNEFVFLVGICGKLYPNGNFLLDFLQATLPLNLATRYHILFQDGFNLLLLNWGVSIWAILFFEGVSRRSIISVASSHKAVVESTEYSNA